MLTTFLSLAGIAVFALVWIAALAGAADAAPPVRRYLKARRPFRPQPAPLPRVFAQKPLPRA